MQFYSARFEEQRKRTSSSMAFNSGVRGHSVCGFGFFPDSQYRSLKPTKFGSFRKFPMSSSSAEFLSGRNPSSDRSKQPSADELRVSLLFALASQAASQSQRFIQGLASEAVKYVNPRRFEVNSLEEAFMSVPDLETVSFRVIRRERSYEIREFQSYYVAETTMPGDTGFDFYGSSQAFNTLAAYLFGKNAKSEEMAMTTPVISQQAQFDGEKMEMTTPVFTRKAPERSKWVMSFVMPSKYGADLPLPVDTSVRIKQIPEKVVAVAVFSGLVTNGEVEQREAKLRAALSKDPLVRIKENASVEVAQYNPPFTLPFMRRNEISLEVELVKDLTS